MASAETSESNSVSRNGMGIGYCNDDYTNVDESKDLGEDLLVDFDLYMEDINDRLSISRMVSDSVIKGMVNAVSQEAAEVVAAKEVEVVALKEALSHYRAGCDELGTCVSSRGQYEQKDQKHVMYFHPGSNDLIQHDSLRESICFFSRAAREQLEKLEKFIVNPKGRNCDQITSKPDMKSAFNSLKATLEAMFQEVDVNASVQDLKLDLEIRGEVESMVLCTIFGRIREDYERRVWDVKTILDLVDRFKEISNLHNELDSIHKCLVGSEHSHLNAGMQEIDHFHRKVLSSHGLSSGAVWDRKGKCEESKNSIPETLETSQLKHMTKEELYKYFRIEFTKMKREHESTVQQMTEEYFGLKREFLKEKELLKERGPFAVFKKDKDFELLKNKISEAILKLSDILVGSEKLSEFCKYSREMLESLLSENCKFRDLVYDKKLELRYLSTRASDATKKLSHHSLAEESLHKLVSHLERSLADACTEASIGEQVYKCILREVARQINSNNEDLDVKFVFMQEIMGIIYGEAVRDAKVIIKLDYGEASDLDLAATVMQQIYGIVFQEVLKGMSIEITELNKKCLEDNKSLVFLESKLSKSERELQAEVEENKNLRYQVSMLENSVAENDKSLVEVTAALEKEKLQYELLNEERVLKLRSQHEAVISAKNEELVLLKDKLDNCQKQIDLYETEVAKLRKADKEKMTFISFLEQEQHNLVMLKAKDREHRKQMESVVNVCQGLSKSFADFELRTTESFRWHNVRLENSAFQLHSLTPKLNIYRRTTLLYKERLEKKCSDLQKAEAEVDLLGDEVDALLSLLEKIYVALDHYSPVLQHYPGVSSLPIFIYISLLPQKYFSEYIFGSSKIN